MDVLGNLKKVLTFAFRAGAWTITFKGDTVTPPTKDITINIPDGDASQTLVTDSSTNTLTNKSIDADTNTITNIDNDEIKAGAAIDATKVHDGSVDNTEFGYLDGVTSAIQTQLNTGATNLSDHESEITGAHAASAISQSGNLIAADVQGALDEAELRIEQNETDVALKADKTIDLTAGDGLSGGGDLSANRTFTVNVDDVGIEITADSLNLKDSGVTTAKLADDSVTLDKIAADVAGDGLGQNVSGALEVNVDDVSIETNADALRVKALGIDTAELAASAVTDAKVSDVAASKITGNFPTIGFDSGTVAIAANDIAIPAAATHITITGTGPVNSFSGASSGRNVQIKNTTGAGLVFTNGASLITGTGDNLELADDATIIVYYDGTAYNVVGGAGGGAGGLEISEVSTTVALAEISTHYLTDTTSAGFTITLPEASSLSAAEKKVATIKFSDSSETWTDNNLTIAPASGEAIDGYAVDETLILDVSSTWVSLSWDDTNSNWVVDMSGAGGGGSGGLAIEEYAYGSLPATLVKDIHYLVDFGGGSSLDAPSTMPAVGTDAGSIKVTPINNGGGCTITLTRDGSDQFNDPDLGLDTVYVVDVGSATFNTNVNDNTWEITDAYWAAATDAGETLWQKRYLTSDVTTTTSNVSDLRLENLTIGKTYKVTLFSAAFIGGTTSTESINLEVLQGSSVVVYTAFRLDAHSDVSANYSGTSSIFVCTNNTITVDVNVLATGTSGIDGTGDDQGTWIMIEELPQHTNTTKFTP